MFTENCNTEDSNEECLLDCLSGSVINNATEINLDSIDNTMELKNEELAIVQSDLGSSTIIEISENYMELLKDFESEVCIIQ